METTTQNVRNLRKDEPSRLLLLLPRVHEVYPGSKITGQKVRTGDKDGDDLQTRKNEMHSVQLRIEEIGMQRTQKRDRHH